MFARLGVIVFVGAGKMVEPINVDAKVQKIFHMCTRAFYVIQHEKYSEDKRIGINNTQAGTYNYFEQVVLTFRNVSEEGVKKRLSCCSR